MFMGIFNIAIQPGKGKCDCLFNRNQYTSLIPFIFCMLKKQDHLLPIYRRKHSISTSRHNLSLYHHALV
jgi:hypothetical protein